MSTEALQRHNEALRRLARSTAWHRGGRDAAFREALSIATEVLGVERSAVWLYDDKRERMRCALVLDTKLSAFTSGALIESKDRPNYFRAIEQERIVAADDALSDPRTSEFRDSYLVPNGVGALLDAPILRAGRCIGVVCNEHVGGPRRWSQVEQLFAASIADFVVGAVQADEVRAAQEMLQARESELRQAIEAASLGTWLWTLEDDSIEWADSVGTLFGREPGWRPRDFAEYLSLIHPDDRDVVRRAVSGVVEQGQNRYFIQHRIVLEGGEVRWLEGRGSPERDADGKPVLLRGTVADITQKHLLEEQLLHAQKMEGIGRLAGGVAHDFNNLLTAISGYAYLVQQRVGVDEELSDDMTGILEATARGRALTMQLLTFARQQSVQPEVLDVNDLLRRLHSLLRRVIGADVELVTDVVDEALPVLMDRGQFEQVLVNLAVNARDAMPKGGRLVIAARRSSGQVRIAVSDTGSGMSEEVRKKAFDPFFTTKKPGTGTGLGLATCYGILRQADGHIRIEHTGPRGTTIVIELPAQSAPVTVTPSSDDPRPVARGTETILLTEDEPAVRAVCFRTLEMHGYRVLVASNPDEARAVALDFPEPIALLVADVVMPRGSGPRLAEELRALGKIERALLMSGYAFDELSSELPPNTYFLGKPFLPKQLAAKVREVLDGAPPD